MTAFAEQIQTRVHDALADLQDARDKADEYRIRIHTGELESFARLAHENGVALPELAPFIPH